MSLDQRLSLAAREIAAGVTPPVVDVDAVRARARRGQRRTTSLAIAAVVLAVIAVSASLTLGRQSSAPDPVDPSPSPSPSPTATAWIPDSITPDEVVNAGDAQLGAVGVSTADAARRLAIWSTDSYVGMALTSDGFATATYLHVPFLDGMGGDGPALRVSSPRDDLFLVHGGNSSVEWLVGADGEVRRVVRGGPQIVPDDPRLWYQCESTWRATWCALDPETATAYKWPRAWDGSAVRPGLGMPPWGANPQPRAVGSTGRLEAWWGAGDQLQVRDLGAADAGDYVLDCAPPLMALWSTRSGSGTVDLHTSRDQGATWQVSPRSLPGVDHLWQVRCTPGGGFLALSDKAVWRADASGGPFREVLTVKRHLQAPDGSIPVQAVGDALVVDGQGVAGVSNDDGRTWTRVQTWRSGTRTQ